MSASPQDEPKLDGSVPLSTPEPIRLLAGSDPKERMRGAKALYASGVTRVRDSLQDWGRDDEFRELIVSDPFEGSDGLPYFRMKITVGIAVMPELFEKIRVANSFPPLADAPTDQDVMEFELEFLGIGGEFARLDIITTTAAGGDGVIARFLRKFGEGIQQIEIDVTDVDRATEILRTRFRVEPIYPATRPGANGTRVNFFLVPATNNAKVLVELVEQPKRAPESPFASTQGKPSAGH